MRSRSPRAASCCAAAATQEKHPERRSSSSAGSTTTAERRIAAISGNTITVDVPLSDSFDSKYLGRSGTAVVRIRPPARVSQVGLENLHIECPPQEINHTQPHFTALRINAEDA